MKIQLNELNVLYKHASSYVFYLITLYEAARLDGVDVSWLPHWTVISLGILGVVAKTWKQNPPVVTP
jgi:hypothetical protein